VLDLREVVTLDRRLRGWYQRLESESTTGFGSRSNGWKRIRRASREFTVPPARSYRVREPAAEVALGESFVVETSNLRTPTTGASAEANPATSRSR
jgi:hypothetical protein